MLTGAMLLRAAVRTGKWVGLGIVGPGKRVGTSYLVSAMRRTLQPTPTRLTPLLVAKHKSMTFGPYAL